MRRDAQEINQYNQMYQTRRDTNINFNITPNQINKLNTKAPTPITEMEDFLEFVKRNIKFYGYFMDRAFLVGVIVTGFKRLMEDGRYKKLAKNPTYRRHKYGEMVYSIVQLEKKYFRHVLSESDFLANNYDWYNTNDAERLVEHWTSPHPYYTPEELPLELQPLPTIPPPLPPPGPPLLPPPPPPAGGNPFTGHSNGNNYYGPGGGNYNPRNGNGGGRGNGRRGQQGNQGRNQNDPQGGATQTNPMHHPLFKHFWDTAPQNIRNRGIGGIFRGANTTTGRIVQQLGLEFNDCGLYHITGQCILGQNCHKNHTPRQLDGRAVQTAVAALQEGSRHIR